MAFNFPSNPTAGQVYGNYTYNATTNAWDIISFSDGIPAGVIMAWGASAAPANWLICDGTAVSRSTYASLFNAIGTTYGAGNGSTTFNLPDLRGRVIVGKNGATFGTLGATGGAEDVTLTSAQIPSHTHSGNTNGQSNEHTHGFSATTSTNGAHTHSLSGSNGGSTNLGPSVTSNSNGDFGYLLNGGRANSAGDHSHTVSGNTAGTSSNHTHSFTTDSGTGGNGSHTNLQPYVVTNYIIKYSAANTPGDSELATRVGTLETANASTNKSGIVPIIPSSISVSSGSASVGANGAITFSGATSVNLNGVFSSSYKNYKIVMNATTNTATTALLRLRSGGSDATVAAYNQAGFSSNSSGLGPFNATALAYFILFDTYAGIESGASLDMYNPQTTQQTTATGLTVGVPAGTVRATSSNMYHSTGASYDGFSLLTNNSYTLSGTIQVYGYK